MNREYYANDVYLPFYENDTRIQIYFGGSSSGKSYFLASRAVLDVLSGRNYLVLRNVARTVRNSVFNEVTKAIFSLDLENWFKINKADMTITCKRNQKQMIFGGLDNVEKLKSTTPINGVLTDIWVEEATESRREDYKQLLKRLRGVSNVSKRVTLSFNPITKTHWIYKEFFRNWEDDKNWYGDEKLSILKTTYKDNYFLMPDDIAELEDETDPYFYDVYTLGNWGVLGGLILTNFKKKRFDIDFQYFDAMAIGQDFGFNHANAILLLGYKDSEVYVCDELYVKGLESNEIMTLADEKFRKDVLMWCDSAEPDRIKMFRNHGWRARGVKKNKNSVQAQIDWLKGRTIYIHPQCENTLAEIQQWKWKEDPKTGEKLDEPVNEFDDAMAALRYGVEGWRRGKNISFD